MPPSQKNPHEPPIRNKFFDYLITRLTGQPKPQSHERLTISNQSDRHGHKHRHYQRHLTDQGYNPQPQFLNHSRIASVETEFWGKAHSAQARNLLQKPLKASVRGGSTDRSNEDTDASTRKISTPDSHRRRRPHHHRSSRSKSTIQPPQPVVINVAHATFSVSSSADTRDFNQNILPALRALRITGLEVLTDKTEPFGNPTRPNIEGLEILSDKESLQEPSSSTISRQSTRNVSPDTLGQMFKHEIEEDIHPGTNGHSVEITRPQVRPVSDKVSVVSCGTNKRGSGETRFGDFIPDFKSSLIPRPLQIRTSGKSPVEAIHCRQRSGCSSESSIKSSTRSTPPVQLRPPAISLKAARIRGADWGSHNSTRSPGAPNSPPATSPKSARTSGPIKDDIVDPGCPGRRIPVVRLAADASPQRNIRQTELYADVQELCDPSELCRICRLIRVPQDEDIREVHHQLCSKCEGLAFIPDPSRTQKDPIPDQVGSSSTSEQCLVRPPSPLWLGSQSTFRYPRTQRLIEPLIPPRAEHESPPPVPPKDVIFQSRRRRPKAESSDDRWGSQATPTSPLANEWVVPIMLSAQVSEEEAFVPQNATRSATRAVNGSNNEPYLLPL